MRGGQVLLRRCRIAFEEVFPPLHKPKLSPRFDQSLVEGRESCCRELRAINFRQDAEETRNHLLFVGGRRVAMYPPQEEHLTLKCDFRASSG